MMWGIVQIIMIKINLQPHLPHQTTEILFRDSQAIKACESWMRAQDLESYGLKA